MTCFSPPCLRALTFKDVNRGACPTVTGRGRTDGAPTSRLPGVRGRRPFVPAMRSCLLSDALTPAVWQVRERLLLSRRQRASHLYVK